MNQKTVLAFEECGVVVEADSYNLTGVDSLQSKVIVTQRGVRIQRWGSLELIIS